MHMYIIICTHPVHTHPTQCLSIVWATDDYWHRQGRPWWEGYTAPLPHTASSRRPPGRSNEGEQTRWCNQSIVYKCKDYDKWHNRFSKLAKSTWFMTSPSSKLLSTSIHECESARIEVQMVWATSLHAFVAYQWKIYKTHCRSWPSLNACHEDK